MRPWRTCNRALKLMDVDAVARAVGVTPRTVRNWRTTDRRSYPRHNQARALLACVHTWLDHSSLPAGKGKSVSGRFVRWFLVGDPRLRAAPALG